MTEKNIMYAQPPRCGKTAMNEFEKQFRDMDQEAFHKALKKLLVKKCECGAELPQYPYYSETHEIYTCPACGKTYRITRRGLR